MDYTSKVNCQSLNLFPCSSFLHPVRQKCSGNRARYSEVYDSPRTSKSDVLRYVLCPLILWVYLSHEMIPAPNWWQLHRTNEGTRLQTIIKIFYKVSNKTDSLHRQIFFLFVPNPKQKSIPEPLMVNKVQSIVSKWVSNTQWVMCYSFSSRQLIG